MDLEGEKCILNDVICVPGLAHNLISVAKVLKHGGSVIFSKKSGKIMDGKRILSYVNFNHADNHFIVKCVPVKCMTQYGSVLSAENKGEHDLIGDGCLSGSKEDLRHSKFGLSFQLTLTTKASMMFCGSFTVMFVVLCPTP